jgi:hypothetical protein
VFVFRLCESWIESEPRWNSKRRKLLPTSKRWPNKVAVDEREINKFSSAANENFLK